MSQNWRERDKRYRERHYQDYKNTQRRSYLKRADMGRATAIQLLGGKCEGCGTNDASQLEFRYRPGEVHRFELSANWGKPWGSWLKPEVQKCVLRCKKCTLFQRFPGLFPVPPKLHEVEHLSSCKSAQERRAANKAKCLSMLGGKCQSCGITDPRVLQFDHIDPTQKDRPVTALMSSRNPLMLFAEIQKCQLLCANCHFIRSVEAGHIGRKRGGKDSKPRAAYRKRTKEVQLLP